MFVFPDFQDSMYFGKNSHVKDVHRETEQSLPVLLCLRGDINAYLYRSSRIRHGLWFIFFLGDYLGLMRASYGIICNFDKIIFLKRFNHKAPARLPVQMLHILTQTVFAFCPSRFVMFPRFHTHV